MIGGRVERVEAMVFVFDLRTIGNHEADFTKTADDIFRGLGEGMELAERTTAAGQRKICRFLRESRTKLQFTTAVGQCRFNFSLGSIDGFTSCGFLLFGKSAQLLHQGSKLAVRAEPIDASLIEASQVGSGAQFGKRRLL